MLGARLRAHGGGVCRFELVSVVGYLCVPQAELELRSPESAAVGLSACTPMHLEREAGPVTGTPAPRELGRWGLRG